MQNAYILLLTQIINLKLVIVWSTITSLSSFQREWFLLGFPWPVIFKLSYFSIFPDEFCQFLFCGQICLPLYIFLFIIPKATFAHNTFFKSSLAGSCPHKYTYKGLVHITYFLIFMIVCWFVYKPFRETFLDYSIANFVVIIRCFTRALNSFMLVISFYWFDTSVWIFCVSFTYYCIETWSVITSFKNTFPYFIF